jgi:hypothetical protein
MQGEGKSFFAKEAGTFRRKAQNQHKTLLTLQK